MCPFFNLPSCATFFFLSFLCLLLVIYLFKMAPKYDAKVLSSVRKLQKAMLCLLDKTCVLDKFHFNRSSSAVVHECSVYESTMYTELYEMRRLKHKHKTRLCIGHLMKTLWSEACRNLPLCFLGSNGSVFTNSVSTVTS